MMGILDLRMWFVLFGLQISFGRRMFSNTTIIECAPYMNTIQRFFEQQHDIAITPQLNRLQITWISAALHSIALPNLKPSFLVFGLGFDSELWSKINCDGVTYFLEDNQEWYNKIRAIAPHLPAYHVKYNTTIEKADEYFAAPWSLELPVAVARTCYDVILIDGPAGYDLTTPGRMQPTKFSVDHIISCLLRGEKDKVHLFLHDAQRPLEYRLIRHIIEPINQSSIANKVLILKYQGSIHGHFGLLKGWVAVLQHETVKRQ